MEQRQQAQPERRCRATNKRGEACRATVVDSSGYCVAHSGRVDMVELGRRGGRSSGHVKPEQVPQSLREELRALDPKTVKAAVEQALTGGNESARVSAVKLLADLDVYGGRECPVCAKNASIDMDAVRQKLTGLLVVQSRQAELDREKEIEARAQEIAEQRIAWALSGPGGRPASQPPKPQPVAPSQRIEDP